MVVVVLLALGVVVLFVVFYDLGWLTGCGCHGGHGYPPLDGVDKKKWGGWRITRGQGAGPHCLPSSAGNNNQYRLAWQPTKNTKEIISSGRTHKLNIHRTVHI